MNELKTCCPHCGQSLEAAAELANEQIVCPNCQGAFLLMPSVAALETPPPAAIAPKPAGLRLAASSEPPRSSATPGAGCSAFCTQCGNALVPGVAFCGSCGAATGQGRPGIPPRPTPTPTPANFAGLPEHVAGGLCYVGGWVTGLIFLLIDRRPFVRFHAAQSLISFGALMVVGMVVGPLIGMAMTSTFTPGAMPNLTWLRVVSLGTNAVWLLGLIVWVLCLTSAFKGERFHVPIVGAIAEDIAAKG